MSKHSKPKANYVILQRGEHSPTGKMTFSITNENGVLVPVTLERGVPEIKIFNLNGANAKFIRTLIDVYHYEDKVAMAKQTLSEVE